MNRKRSGKNYKPNVHCARKKFPAEKQLPVVLFKFPDLINETEGKNLLGKLRIYKSGEIRAVINGVDFNVDKIKSDTSEEAVAIENEEIYQLGVISEKITLSPDWDLEENLVPVYKSTKHRGIINAIDGVAGTSVGCGAPEIVTGSKDGTVMIWDVRQKDDPVATFKAAEGSTARDCWSVAFGNSYNSEERVVAAGYDNGDIKLYDLKAMKVLWSKSVKNGVVSLQFDRKDIQMNKLVATTLESKIVVYDVRTQHPTRGFAHASEKAHESTIWQVKHLPQNRDVFMTTGGAGSLCLWKYIYPDKRIENDGDGIPLGVIGELQLVQNSTLSSQPVVSFDWCRDKLGLAVCASFDQTVRILITTKLNLY